MTGVHDRVHRDSTLSAHPTENTDGCKAVVRAKLAPEGLGNAKPDYIPQRSAAVCTGASHKASCPASAAVRVIEQPAISSEVT